MNILFDVNHPAHVHFFKHPIWELEELGHNCLVTSREKDVTVELLDEYDLDHQPLTSQGSGLVSLATEWAIRGAKMVNVARKFSPDVIVSRPNPVAVHTASLFRCPVILFSDSDVSSAGSVVQQAVQKTSYPFADLICTPKSLNWDFGESHCRLNGYFELSYLHPDRFEPKPELLSAHGIDPESRFFVLRFISWEAYHDEDQSGLSRSTKQRMVEYLSDLGDVYITSESELPGEFEQYRLPLPPSVIHHALYYADLYVGDSQTMATEAAILGTPTVRSNSFAGDDDMSNFIELEETYKLMYSTPNENDALDRIMELAADEDAPREWSERRANLIEETSDITEDIVSAILERVR
ncbi:DUF354 domain-containing protein [Halovivax cerinus]|uniref:DUF354 domain-containing protein n=1 Tax=Halovivax cerinus TaxID=1487865 RepID=A0ABD5NQU7_9EURY|nr:DUF354 domain-containing protein [Halovivax cerinus]